MADFHNPEADAYLTRLLENFDETVDEFIDEDCLEILPSLLRVSLLERLHKYQIKAQKIQDVLDVLFPDEADCD